MDAKGRVSRKRSNKLCPVMGIGRLRTDHWFSDGEVTGELDKSSIGDRPNGVGLKENCQNGCEDNEYRCFFQGVFL